MVENRITADTRLDPRIKALLGAVDLDNEGTGGDVADRQALIDEAGTEAAVAQRAMFAVFADLCDTE
ncbi:MAG: hypothetical protein ACRDY1_09735, partial [Acidimicrobiales bacterium]